MKRFFFTEDEKNSIAGLLQDLSSTFSIVDDDFFDNARVYAEELPRRIRQIFNTFRLKEDPCGGFILSGFPVQDEKIGETPKHWKNYDKDENTKEENMLFIILSSLLGEPFGFKTQQNGTLVHEIFPIEQYATEQMGCGYKNTLEWHTEDAFLNYRADYLSLMCLRNPQKIATTICTVDMLDFDFEDADMLFEEHFVIHPDSSHFSKNNFYGNDCEKLQQSFSQIEEMQKKPQKVAVLFGDRKQPYIRIDPAYMGKSENPRAQKVLERFFEIINNNLADVILDSGEILFIDNHKAVHGRKPFVPKFNGYDRWLRRLNITVDLKKTRYLRSSCSSRVI